MVFALTDELVFPPVELADESGLLAVGGDLSVARLRLAYRSGIFPWYSDDTPILWFSPDPRMVLHPSELRVTRSLARVVQGERFTVSWDQDFRGVISNCQNIVRPGQEDTWITDDMREAYIALHDAGDAHSVEVCRDGQLVGGLYGVSAGRAFCGESMFSLESNASKVGFVWLVDRLASNGTELIDCQIYTPHLESLGAREIPRADFVAALQSALA